MADRCLCVIPGDGIGPEVTSAAVDILMSMTDDVKITYADAGWKTFLATGDSVPESTLDQLRECGAGLFGAVSSPARKVEGYRSAILRIRQELELFANIRPVRGRWSRQAESEIDFVIVRENSEGLYCGLEHSDGERAVSQRIITRHASQRIGRTAVKIAAENCMSRITIAHKANVLPLGDGLFRDAAREAIENDSRSIDVAESLVDILAYQLVAEPQQFEVIVTTNMFGDILSDLAAYWCGGMGRAPSLNMGDNLAVAEPVHGSAPDIAGNGIADPSATILSLALLCKYYWQDHTLAERLEAATVQAIYEFAESTGVTTREFSQRVMENIRRESTQRPATNEGATAH